MNTPTAGDTPLFTPERRNLIVRHLREHGSARVADLADLLGVSGVTVRRDVEALERDGRVQRFHGGVTLHGEVPGATGEAPTALRLGVLIPNNAYFKQVLEGVKQQAARFGATLSVALTDYDTGYDEAVVATFKSRGVDGVLLAPTPDGHGNVEIADELRALRIPTVLIERRLDASITGDYFDHIVSDHRVGARCAVEHLAALGHRRVALAVKEAGPTGAQVRDGYRYARTALALDEDLPVIDIAQVDAYERGAPQRISQALDALARLEATAVLVHSDAEAVMLTQQALGRGLRIPEDLAVVSYDDDLAAFATVPLTAVSPPHRALGRAGFDLLAARIRDGADRPVHQLSLQPRLVVRESCGGRPDRTVSFP
jgi:DNA-binding LacI/PurR family transcriptional regulator